MYAYDNIPAELRALRQWVAWRYMQDTEHPEKKPRKVPVNARTGAPAKSSDPSTWAAYDDAIHCPYHNDGIGFMFSPPYFGVDIDGVDGDIADWQSGGNDNIVAEFVCTLASYAEYSVSGRGIHIICRGELPPSGNRRGNVEMYATGRFFTMTGNLASEYSEIADCTEKIKPLHEKYIGAGREPAAYNRPETPTSASVDEIVSAASKSKQGELFRRLFAGEWESFFTSQSEADMSLANMLAFWCRRDVAAMDAVFRASGLMRDKWDRRQAGSTYGALTLQKAARECSSVYGERRTGIRFSGSVPRSKPDFSRYTLDDTGCAARLSDMFGEVVRYCYPDNKWYYFDGRRWLPDCTGAICRVVDDVCDAIRADCEDFVEMCTSHDDSAKPEDARETYMKFVKKTRSNQTKTAIVKESRSRVPLLPAELDTNKLLLNTPSGVVDLRAATVSPHNPALLMTKLTVAEYSDHADCPRWEQFLSEIFDGDAALIRYVQKAVGYSLTGEVSEQCMFFAVGDGSNGKSTFFETIAGAIGDYAANVQPATLLAKGNSNAISTDLARLKGPRFVTVPEPAEGARLDEGLVKQLSGGDRVTARKLYAEEMEFAPEFKIWMATNHKPVIRGTDYGIWRRIRIIPFAVKIAPDKVDRSLRYKLMAEYPAILRWAVEGALAWQREGLEPTSVMLDAVREYRNEMDVVQSFVSECTNPVGETDAGELYKTYVEWARDSNEYVMSATRFGRECVKRFEKRRSNGWKYQGVSIKPEYNYKKIQFGYATR